MFLILGQTKLGFHMKYTVGSRLHFGLFISYFSMSKCISYFVWNILQWKSFFMLALFSSVMETLCTSCESVFKKRKPVSSAFYLSELFLPTLSDLTLLQCAVIMAHLLASNYHVPPYSETTNSLSSWEFACGRVSISKQGDILVTLLLAFTGTACACVCLPALMVGASKPRLWEDRTASPWQRSR